ncbi:hypothetical protein [Nonomuraea recticatena]|uniref:hypothetical protein n=1 Tax=Nonomuraea recticatena TaxID=46178 RepID=UPI00361ED07F
MASAWPSPSMSSQRCTLTVSTQPDSHGPAPAGGPAVKAPVAGSIQPTVCGLAAVAPQSAQPDRTTSRTGLPSGRHSDADAIEGLQQPSTVTGPPLPVGHGCGSTAIQRPSPLRVRLLRRCVGAG